MLNLLYKEFKLSIHPFFLLFPFLIGALMLIPQWIFTLVPLYFCFVSIPNLFSSYKAFNDLSFLAMLPVSKSDIVKARIGAVVGLELLHILLAAIFALLNRAIYHNPNNFALDLNPAFFGLVFVIYGVFNLIMLPMFFKTGYSFGVPLIISITAATLLGLGMELLIIFNSSLRYLMEESGNGIQALLLILGMGLFTLSIFETYILSIRRFESVDV